jgi:hypothetical protein
MAYDTYGRLHDRLIRMSDQTVGQRFRYGYDPNGNVARTTFAYDTAQEIQRYVVYAYDALDRLTMEQWWGQWYSGEELQEEARLWQRNYVCDAVGNRTAMGWFNGSTTSTTTYQYNMLNQLTYGSAGAYNYFRYDWNGDLISRTSTDNGDVGWHYLWTEDDRMARAYEILDSKIGEDHGTTFCYDAMGRRILRQDDDGTWTRYFYDGLNVVLEREATTSPSTWNETLLANTDSGTAGFSIWDNDPSGSTLVNDARDRILY